MSELRAPDRTGSRPTRRLYRSVLSIAVAALVAAWLPFSIIYIDALTKRAAAAYSAGAARPTALAGGTRPSQPLTPIITRASGAP